MSNLKNTLNKIVDLHEQMKGAYFFTPPLMAYERRRYEENHSLKSEFEYKGNKYLVEQTTTCSCKNVYYKIFYYENGVSISKDIRFIKKIISDIEKMDISKKP